MLGFFLDFLFPKKCVNCAKIGAYLCRSCQTKIAVPEYVICPVCERRAIDGITHPGCKTRYSLDGLWSLYRYDGPVKASIKRLKYKPYLAELVTILTSQVNNETMRQLSNDSFVIPVPLHPQRERERGFNQAALIGKALATKLGLRFQDHVLKRTRYTKPQVILKGKERRENLIGAFAASSNYTLDAIR